MRILYPNGDKLSIIIPTGELSDEETALKDVPAGVPFVYINDADVPADRYFRNAWEADFAKPDGYGMGHDAWAAQKNK